MKTARVKENETGVTMYRTNFKNMTELVDWVVGDRDFVYSYADREPRELAVELAEILKNAAPEEDEYRDCITVTPLEVAGRLIEDGKAQREELREEARHAASEEAEWAREMMRAMGASRALVDIDMEYALTFREVDKVRKEPVDAIRHGASGIPISDTEGGVEPVFEEIYRFLTEKVIPECIRSGLYPDIDYNFTAYVNVREMKEVESCEEAFQ